MNNAVYYQIKDDPKNKGIPIPELINNSKNYAVSYIDKDTLMAMYNYFASRTSANESVLFYEHTLNEDHSEISNDPEMEKLLALAGCTIEDLDTINNEEDIELDDDDPIDVNTSREIDAVIDESAADDYHKNHEERMKNLNKKIDELNNDRKKDNEVREKQDKNAAALRDLLGESTPDLDFIMESIFMDIDH